ncbi:hypothetical protein SRABI106_03437 [Rahnella aquatilis]|nr:hypothetical protein SRABI106_03437 [Rahnella aquatilis]
MGSHFTVVGISLTADVVMQIVEFSHLRVTPFEHFDIQLTGNDTHLLRCEALHYAIHQVTPGPEAVLRITGDFRQPGHHPLKGVRMEVRHARNHRAGKGKTPLRIVVRGHCSQHSGCIDVQPHVMRPAI